MRKRIGAALAALALAAALLFASGGPAGATGVGTGKVLIVAPGQSIQAAVDAASPGTTIIVLAGTYAQQVEIRKDNITLLGFGATIVPPAVPRSDACAFGPDAPDGICVAGDFTFPQDDTPPAATRLVSNVVVSGFTVRGFSGIGIVFVATRNPVVTNTVTVDNDEYGIARFISTGGLILGNKTSGSAEAGIYIGDSPSANVLVTGNEASGSLFGFFMRDAANGTLTGNRSHDNCVGAIVLNTGPNVAGNWLFTGNTLTHNNQPCPADEEEGTPPLSGIGLFIVNASGNTARGNVITDNAPSEQVDFSGGVVVLSDPTGPPTLNPPSNNTVQGNVIVRNQTDIFWDGTGTGNVIRPNVCATSVPPGIC
jgi:parallel beta-helix repeat protein